MWGGVPDYCQKLSRLMDTEIHGDELVAGLWKVSTGRTTLSKLVDGVCVEETSRCGSKGPTLMLSKERVDYAFEPRRLGP